MRKPATLMLLFALAASGCGRQGEGKVQMINAQPGRTLGATLLETDTSALADTVASGFSVPGDAEGMRRIEMQLGQHGVIRVLAVVPSPDGELAAVAGLYGAPSETISFAADLWLMDAAETSIVRRLTSSRDATVPIWAPSGDSLAFAAAAGVRVISPFTDRGNLYPTGRGVRSLVWSPSSDALAFVESGGETAGVVVIRSSDAAPLYRGTAQARRVEWTASRDLRIVHHDGTEAWVSWREIRAGL